MSFSIFFFQNNNFFLQTQGLKIADLQRPLKTQEQSFFHDVLQNRRGLKKKKKKFKTFYHFSDLISIFRVFPSLENCRENFKTFSRIQDFVRTLYDALPGRDDALLMPIKVARCIILSLILTFSFHYCFYSNTDKPSVSKSKGYPLQWRIQTYR